LKIGFGGSFPKEACSRSSPSLTHWLVLKVVMEECVADLNSLEGGFSFFSWKSTPGKILTVDNLRKMPVIIVDRCCLCKRNGKSMDHILCYVSRCM
jgi:hypothetical protein